MDVLCGAAILFPFGKNGRYDRKSMILYFSAAGKTEWYANEKRLRMEWLAVRASRRVPTFM